ncbi:dCMP deaminase [Micromonospora sp. NBC_01813]|uniref:dCMP deaminase n=1 Tax=Micromonospora sp. NBC_01813 TaxID=2975988 RepID=UPI002DDB03B3|nr:dCMP deaminase [Micromonospora sp. NBC_01813]WSA09500.1 dCMP deaminase [Micromonospora sp. NBC_01813]
MSEASDVDRHWLHQAIDLSRRCPPTDVGYAVGAIVVAADGSSPLATGYSRDDGSRVHAEESALRKLGWPCGHPAGPELATTTMYSSLEPCSVRLSSSTTCVQIILAAGIRRVVFALLEPPLFVDCQGAELLRDAGVDVVHLPELGELVIDVNRQTLR